MKLDIPTLLAVLAASSTASAKSIPSNLKRFYEDHAHNSTEDQVLSAPFHSYYGRSTPSDMVYARDTCSNAVFLKRTGSHSAKAAYSDMDIDCDGENASEGKCFNDPTGQSITSFQYLVKGYDRGVRDLDAHIHPYVVFGNTGDKPSYNPRSAGIKPLSVVAVVCGDQLRYGIWGDVNGATVVGEASLAMGQFCYGDAVDGNHGHEGHDVLYIAFPGEEAVPGPDGAKWDAKNAAEFEASITKLGDKLVAGLQSCNSARGSACQ